MIDPHRARSDANTFQGSFFCKYWLPRREMDIALFKPALRCTPFMALLYSPSSSLTCFTHSSSSESGVSSGTLLSNFLCKNVSVRLARLPTLASNSSLFFACRSDQTKTASADSGRLTRR